MVDETNEAKLARLRKEKADRAKEMADTRDAAELAELELESRFSADGGKLGVDFAMVVDRDLGPDGIIVLKLGADLAFRKFVDATMAASGSPSAADMFDFTAPAVVHPAPDAYAKLVRQRSGLADRACNALTSLHRLKASKIDGKF
jgi:hypothetical protein